MRSFVCLSYHNESSCYLINALAVRAVSVLVYVLLCTASRTSGDLHSHPRFICMRAAASAVRSYTAATAAAATALLRLRCCSW
jgi:hypothetical protein